MTSKYFFAAIGLLALAACSNPEPNQEMIPVVIVAGEGDTPDYDPTVIPEFTYGVPVYAGQKAADAESYPQGNPDLNPNENEWSTTVRVVYNGATATVSGAAEAGITATVTGANVDLALGQTRGVRIIASGSSDCGSLRLTGSYKHLLELSDLTLTATDRPAINDQIKKRVFLIARGHNRLTDGENYLTSSEQRKGCVFAEDHIVLGGDGILEICGRYRHGLVSDGYLFVNPGVTLAVTNAGKNAIHIKGSGATNDFRGIEITGGYVFASTSAPAGKAMKSDSKIQIRGGELVLASSGTTAVDDEGLLSSAGCIKSDADVTVTGGSIALTSTANGGKGITADGNITISGSRLSIALSGNAEEGDADSSVPKALNAHGSLAITAGGVSISAIGNGSTAMSGDVAMAMSGGVVYAFATNNGLKTPGAAVTGGVLLCGGARNSEATGATLTGYSSVNDGHLTELFDANGALAASFRWPRAMESASLLSRF